MKRDMDLIRLILLDEKGETEVDLSPYTPEQFYHHKKLLLDRGFVEGVAFSTLDGGDIKIQSLTWEGHDFLDAARDENVWQEAMHQIGKNVVSVSLETLKAVLVSVATKMITGGQP